MVSYDDSDTHLEELVKELGSLLKTQKESPGSFSMSKTETGYQAPIKGTFYNSGNFSMSATDPRHPTGHMGVDMRASAGTPIYPMAVGVVTNVGSDPKGGNVVNIQHSNGLRSYYAHMSTVKVYKGDKVDLNTVIGTVGNTGNANVTWPHLHFQVWKDNQIQNPAQFFSIPKYTNVDKTKEKWWANEQSKNDAQIFSMQKHKAERQTTLAHNISALVKISELYYKLSIK